MFDILDFDTILEKFEKRNSIIKKLDKIPVKDSNYLAFISNYKSVELNADMEIFDYDVSLRENRYIKENYPVISEKFWIVGRTGQGDEWFIDTQSSEQILFYDHNKGEYNTEGFSQLGISFEQFIKMGKVVQQLDNHLDNETDVEERQMVDAMNRISSNLYEKYPYKYW